MNSCGLSEQSPLIQDLEGRKPESRLSIDMGDVGWNQIALGYIGLDSDFGVVATSTTHETLFLCLLLNHDHDLISDQAMAECKG